jgi:probable F420-dependent oxidoreductase
MKVGIVFPQTEIGSDPRVIREFAQGAEEAGFHHLLVYDHVLGADRNRPGGFRGPYDKDTPFHEPFVLFGYLAAATTRIELVTGVIILPQRQAALVAKQAAEVDLLSGGRLRLGVGTGWNAVEYEALGMNFHDRGKRQEEQIALMRALWERDSITFEGRWHRVTQAGLNPLPGRRIPIWLGGFADAALERAGRIADGWFPLVAPDEPGKAQVAKVHAALKKAGRDPLQFGIDPQGRIAGGNPDRWRRHAQDWRGLGATHISVVTMGSGFKTPDAHLKAACDYKAAIA